VPKTDPASLSSLPRGGIYLITNDAICSSESKLLRGVSQALDAGIEWIQFRAKPDGPFGNQQAKINITLKLKKLCESAKARLFINDDLGIAKQCEVDLHLGQRDEPIASARSTLKPDQLIGLTCHDQIPLAEQGIRSGANYVSFGAFFTSKTKPKAKVISPEILQDAHKLNHTIVAIGGINLENGRELFARGADIIAVSNAILSAPDISKTCQHFLALASKNSGVHNDNRTI